MVVEQFCKDNALIGNFGEQVEQCAEMLADLFLNKGTLLLCGNGGSAADCEHVVGELVKEFRAHRGIGGDWKNQLPEDLATRLCDGLKAISLCSQVSILTALANDVGYDYAFAQQVAVYGNEKDVLWAFSTSGNSTCVVNAAITARAKGMKVVSFTNCQGGKLAEVSDVCFKFPSKDTYRVQEFTIAVYHAICARFEELLWKK